MNERCEFGICECPYNLDGRCIYSLYKFGIKLFSQNSQNIIDEKIPVDCIHAINHSLN